MFVIPAILAVLNILLIVFYYYLTLIDQRNALKETERLRDELREMDRKLIYGYWNHRYSENK
nr:MAG TPA: Narbonolide/10-deoxymethynolide synthase PikA4 N-terminal domain [Caudoviricetes sp.]